MRTTTALAPWIKRFLLEYLPGERNFSYNTQCSYRDAVRLLVIFAGRNLRKKPDQLSVEDISAELLRKFLQDIEEARGCTVRTRNQRLAAVHALAAFIGERCPELLKWCAQIKTVSFKRSSIEPVGYLEKSEIDALLAAPDQSKRLGARDYLLLLFMYNSGARADEVAQLTIGNLRLCGPGKKAQSFVQLNGKGNKVRFCPLWASTASLLRGHVEGRGEAERVFQNRLGQPMTRFGVHDVVTRYARLAKERHASLANKQVSPHTIRHYSAFLTITE